MNLGSFRILLPFFRTSWGVGFLKSAIVNSFHNWVEFGTILEGLRNFGEGGGLNTPTPLRYVTDGECFIAQPEAECLGFITSSSGAKANRAKFQAV